MTPSHSAPTANRRADLRAGFLVFLIALPLCLGVAMASGFPPMAGILSAIVGGLLVSRINSSHLTITGPAAGLITVLYTAVQTLGEEDALAGYRYTLAAVVIAGALQLVLSRLRAGRLSAFFPLSVVHGMLAAIGIIIIVRQLHILLGARPPATTLFEAIVEMPWSLLHFNPEVTLVGGLGLLTLFTWPLLKDNPLGRIPAPLIVVVSGWLLGQILDLHHVYLYLMPPEVQGDPARLLSYVPDPQFLSGLPDSITDSMVFPDFAKLATTAFWGTVVSLCLIGSLESLLVVAAIDKLDPQQRRSDPDRDLAAVGIGNVVAGSIGGMPIIAEIVRSSANVGYGANSGWANFFHGAFMLFFVALFPRLIQQIPLASLAALLIYAGCRLASPQAFAKTMAVGAEQLALFIITIVGILATDLLIGIGLGVVAKLLIHRYRGVKIGNLFRLSYQVIREAPESYRIVVRGGAVFSNLAALETELVTLPKHAHCVFDLSRADLIDHTVMEFLDQFRQRRLAQGVRCEIRGLEHYERYGDHPLAARHRPDA